MWSLCVESLWSLCVESLWSLSVESRLMSLILHASRNRNMSLLPFGCVELFTNNPNPSHHNEAGAWKGPFAATTQQW